MEKKYKVLKMSDKCSDENRTAAEIIERAAAGGILVGEDIFTWERNIQSAAKYFSEIQDGRFANEVIEAMKVVREHLIEV